MTSAGAQSGANEATDKVGASHAVDHYVLRLFVTGSSPRSVRAIENIRTICETYLEGRYELDVVDISQYPALAGSEQIIAAPTLIKKLPLPLRQFIGDMSQTDRILAGLGLQHLVVGTMPFAGH